MTSTEKREKEMKGGRIGEKPGVGEEREREEGKRGEEKGERGGRAKEKGERRGEGITRWCKRWRFPGQLIARFISFWAY